MHTPPEQNGRQTEIFDRLSRLQALTAALSEAVTSEQVADAILTHCLSLLGAGAGVIYRLSDDSTSFVCLHMVGYPNEAANTWSSFPADVRTPVADAAREGRLVIVPTLAEMRSRYPVTEQFPTLQGEASVIALPLIVRGRAIGGIGLRFAGECSFPDEDQPFLLTLAGLCAQALERARLFDRERAARERAERAEQALRSSEERLRTLSNNLPLGAVYQAIADPDGARRILYISAGVEHLLGVSPAEALENPYAIYGLIHAEDAARLAAAEDTALRNLTPFDCELRSWTRSGRLIWVHARSAPRRLPTGQVVWEGILLDITARKGAEESLHRERELLQTIIDRIPVMLTVYEPDTKVLRLNPAFEQATGWTRQDAEGLSLMERCYPDPAYRERVRAFMQECRDGWMDIRMRTRAGHDLETSWANVRLSNGTQVGIGLDITERKRYEESLRDADRRKDEFLATLAHELRNPLAPIRNGLQVIQMEGGNAQAVEQARGMMERQLAQMVRLIDDLLDVSRITRGKLQLRRERSAWPTSCKMPSRAVVPSSRRRPIGWR